jgi:hypothetical protein
VVSQCHDAGNDLLPGNRLHVLVGDVEKVEVEVANVDQTLHIQEVLDRLPNEVEGKHPQAEVPQTRHVLSALGNKDLGKFLATAELAVVDALREKRQEESHKNNVAASSD